MIKFLSSGAGRLRGPMAGRVLAFMLPVLISLVILAGGGVYPFGDQCILHIDMYHQYAPFFTELMNKLKNGESLLYSFRIGLGSDFVALFAYYLASPFNWLLAFCQENYVIEFMTILTLIKIGLCGSSFACYVRRHFHTDDVSAAVFACFYALSGYMAAYSWNIMWLDCVALAPWILLGLELLVKEGKTGMYCICLGAAILSNFYIAIMLCIFSVIYFFILLFEEAGTAAKRVKAFGRFTLYSLLAGGMGAVLIIPEAVILSYSGSSGVSFPEGMEWYFHIAQELARHCFSVDVYTGRDHWPNLYCGCGVLPLVVLYFLNKRISWKKKIVRALFIVFFWASFANNMLDFVWHGLHFPDSLPGRQSFLYIFLLLVLAYEAYHHRREVTPCQMFLAVGISWGFLSLAAFAAKPDMIMAESILITGVLVGGYGALFFLWHLGRGELKSIAGLMALALAVTEVYVNFSVTGFDLTSRSGYTKNWDSVKSLLAQVDAAEEEEFYRVEETERLTKNDAALYHYPSATIFSSLMNIGVGNFYRKVGMEGGKNFYSYSGSTPLSSAMLSVKYLISQSPHEESPLRKIAAEDGRNYIYENVYTLPLGFMVEPDLEAAWNARRGMPIANINSLARILGAESDLLSPLMPPEVESDVTRVTVKEDCYVYATYENKSVTNIVIKCKDRTRKFTKCDHGYILDLGWCRAGDTVEITNSSKVKDFLVKPYQLNLKSLKQAYETLSRQTMEVDYFSDTKIEGHVSVSSPGNLVVSIPREAGWQVFVDGKETGAGIFMESLTEIPLDAGEHRIELRYFTPGLKEGVMISALSFGVFLGLCMGKRAKKNNHREV